MSLIIKSGATSDLLTVDVTSKAARVTLYGVGGSPITSLPVTPTPPSDVLASGTISVPAGTVSVATQGSSTVVFNVTGTWSGTLQPQLQLADNSWVNTSVFPTLPFGSSVSTITTNGQWKINVGGFQNFRLLATAFTSGTATVNLEASAGQTFIQNLLYGSTGQVLDGIAGSPSTGVVTVQGVVGGTAVPVSFSGNITVVGAAASGSAVSGNPVLVGGSDGTNARTIATDASGQVKVLVQNTPSVTVSGTVGVTQSTSPWVVSLTSTTITGTVAVTQSGTWNIGTVTAVTAITNALPAGTNVIGHVITDTGSTTAVTGTVAVTQSTSPWVVSLTSTTITGTVAVTQSGTWTDRIVGNAGATLDATLAPGTAPTNGVGVLAQYNGTSPILSSGQTASLQTGPAGDLNVSLNDIDTQPGILQKVQAASTGSVASLQSPAFANQNTPVNTIVVVVGYGSNGTITVSDLAGNVYKTAYAQNNSTTFGVAIFYATSIASFAANKVTVSTTSSSSLALQAYEVAGTLVSTAGLVGDRYGTTGANTTPQTGTVTPQGPYSIAFQGIAIGTSAETVSTTGQGWTLDSTQNPTTPSGLFTLVSESAVLGSMGTSTSAYVVTAGAPAASTGNTVLSSTNAYAAVTVTFRNAPIAVQGIVSLVDGSRTTYRATWSAQTAAAGAVVALKGSDTKLVRVTRAQIGGWSAATGVNSTVTFERATISGGTPATPTVHKQDTNDPPATAVLNTFFGGVTTATTVSVINAQSLIVSTTTLTGQTTGFVSDQYGSANGTKQPVLRGSTDCFIMRLSAVGTTPTAFCSGWIEWTEE